MKKNIKNLTKFSLDLSKSSIRSITGGHDPSGQPSEFNRCTTTTTAEGRLHGDTEVFGDWFGDNCPNE